MKNANLPSKKEQQEIVMEELWKAAAFDDQLFQQLSKIVESEELADSILSSEEFYVSLTTNRNRNLISHVEQQKLHACVVSFFGLSVGSHAVLTWILESRANTVKIIDPDIVGATNLNRLRLPWSTIGHKKTDVTEDIITKMHPYCNVMSFSEVTPEMYEQVFHVDPAVSIIVDEIDDLAGKLLLRRYARKLQIPLISATDVGDNVLLDVERYDIDQHTKFFHGIIPQIEEINPLELNLTERISLVLRIVGLESCSVRMLESLLAIGTSLETWPQLGATSTIAGGVITTTIKKIILQEPVLSGRYTISLDSILTPTIDFAQQEKKASLIQQLNNKYPFFL